MKVGILTLPFNNNYGGYLQAFALLTTLKELKIDAELIYRRPNRTHFTLVNKVKFFCKNLMKTIYYREYFPLFLSQETIYNWQGKYMHSFLDKYIIPRTNAIYDKNALEIICKNKYSAVIVGSDQVWRPEYVPFVEDYFLEFVGNLPIKKIAYAASFGCESPNYSKIQIAKCGNLISKFDKVSVREYEAVNIVNGFHWKPNNIDVVLDPTLLLSAKYYIDICKQENSMLDLNQFAVYILDLNKKAKEVVCRCANNLKLSPFYINKSAHKQHILPSVESWLINIKESSFVLTDSFHGTVFAILFNRPFIVLENSSRGASRFNTLLSIFGLQDRVVRNTEDIQMVLDKKINWDKVNKILDKEKTKSISFLLNCFS